MKNKSGIKKKYINFVQKEFNFYLTQKNKKKILTKLPDLIFEYKKNICISIFHHNFFVQFYFVMTEHSPFVTFEHPHNI